MCFDKKYINNMFYFLYLYIIMKIIINKLKINKLDIKIEDYNINYFKLYKKFILNIK